MKWILAGVAIDVVLIPVCWMSAMLRVHLLLTLACANMLYYLFILGRFLYRTSKLPERKGFALEFVVLQTFLCTGIFLFKLCDLIMIHNSL